MGIGVQGEACGEVTQHAGYGLDVHTILESVAADGLAEANNYFLPTGRKCKSSLVSERKL